MNGKVNVFLARKPQYQDSIRKYKVFLDEVQVGEVSRSETFKLAVEPGEHKICLKIDWTSSNTLLFNAKSG